MNKNTIIHLIRIVPPYVGLSVGFLALAMHLQYQARHEELFPRVEYIVDVNEDGITTRKEWEPVYKFFGKKCQPENIAPKRDFSINELEEYLKTHQSKKPPRTP